MEGEPFRVGGGGGLAVARIARVVPGRTPRPTRAPAPTATALPVPGVRIIATGAPVTAVPGKRLQIRYSRYWPALGGVNCSRFVDGICVSNMASGEPWAPWAERAVACPKSWAFDTIVVLPDGSEWTCKDRGGAIKYVDEIPWLDFLTQFPLYGYGTIVEVEVRW